MNLLGEKVNGIYLKSQGWLRLNYLYSGVPAFADAIDQTCTIETTNGGNSCLAMPVN